MPVEASTTLIEVVEIEADEEIVIEVVETTAPRGLYPFTAWINSILYPKNSVVSHEGVLWLALRGNINVEPTSSATSDWYAWLDFTDDFDDITAALALKAPLASPALTGTPTAPTRNGDDATTAIANMAALQLAFAYHFGLAPGILTILEAVAAAFATDNNLATIAGLLTESQTIGRDDDPITGSSIGHATLIFAEPVENDGFLTLVRVFGINSGGTIAIKRFTATGIYPSLTFTQVGSDYSLSISAGLDDYTTDNGLPVIPVVAGEYIGFHGGGTTSGNQKIATVTALGDSGGFYQSAGGSGNVSTFSDSTVTVTSQLQIGFVCSFPYGTAERIQEIEADRDELQNTTSALALARATHFQTIGTIPAGTPQSGSDTGVDTFVFFTPSAADGYIRRIRVYVNGDTTLVVKVFSRTSGVGGNSGILQQRGRDVEIALTAGLHNLTVEDGDFPEIWIRAGEHVGWFANGKVPVLDLNPSDTEGGGYWNAAGKLFKLTDAALAAQFYPQIGFDIYTDTYGTSRCLMPGQPLAAADQVEPTDLNFCTSHGESTAKGTLGASDFFAYTSQYGHTMFGGGIRVARENSVGIYHAPGTSTKVTAVEEISNAANSYDNDTETGTERGVTGLVQLADELSKKANRDLAVPIGTHKFHLASPAHGGYRIDQWGMNSSWGRVLRDQAEDIRPLAAADGLRLKSLWHLLSIANNGVQGIVSAGGVPIWSVEDFDVELERELRSETAMFRYLYDQNDQPHFFLIQTSSYITGNGSINVEQNGTRTNGSPVITSFTTTNWGFRPGLKVSGTGIPAGTVILSVDGPSQITLSQNATSGGTNLVNVEAVDRDGVFQNSMMRLQDRVPWFHIVGPEFFADESTLGHFLSIGSTKRALSAHQPIFEACYLGQVPDLPRRLGSYWDDEGVHQRIYSVTPLAQPDTTTVTGANTITTHGVRVRVEGSNVTIGTPTINNSPTDHAYIREILAPWEVLPDDDDLVEFRLGLDQGNGLLDEGAIHNFRTTYGADFMIGDPATSWTCRRFLPHFSTIAIPR